MFYSLILKTDFKAFSGNYRFIDAEQCPFVVNLYFSV